MMQNVKVHKTMAVPIGTLYTGSNFVDLRAYCSAWWVGGFFFCFFWGGALRTDALEFMYREDTMLIQLFR